MDETKAERREKRRNKRNSHPVHGRGLESIMNSIRRRGKNATDQGLRETDKPVR